MEKRGRYDLAKEYYEKALNYPEKYLSTVKHADIEISIENVEMFARDEKGEEIISEVKEEIKEELISETEISEEEFIEKITEEIPEKTEEVPQETNLGE